MNVKKYIQLKDIEARRILYDKIQAGDKIIVDSKNAVLPMIGK